MKTTIDNNLRVYQVTTSTGSQYFCNIEELNKVVTENNLTPGYFKVCHFWNNKAERLSKKSLLEMFEGAGLKQMFNY